MIAVLEMRTMVYFQSCEKIGSVGLSNSGEMGRHSQGQYPEDPKERKSYPYKMSELNQKIKWKIRFLFLPMNRFIF